MNILKLILASNSKWRKKLINMAGFECEAIPSNVSEDIEFNSPDEYVMELSKRKATEVAGKLTDGIVISADTIGYMDNEKFEKPKSREEAFRNIKKLSGRVNYAVTGVTIIDIEKDKKTTFAEKTEVYFKEMSDEEINWYIDNEKSVYDCAGYSIETAGSLFISKVVGNYTNIVGLPISRIYEEIRNFGYSINDFPVVKD
jgi:septum formation protein